MLNTIRMNKFYQYRELSDEPALSTDYPYVDGLR